MENNNEYSDSISSLMNNPSNPSNPSTASEFPHKEFEKQNNTNSEPGKPTEVLNVGIQEQQQQMQMQETIQQQQNTINKLNFYLQQQEQEKKNQLNQKEKNKTIIEKIKNVNQKEILIMIILFVFLSTPFFKNILKQYLPFTSTDNNINFIGLILSALILVILTIVFKCTY